MIDNPIKKAIIPAAGFGTRLFPATKVFKKEFFPIIDRDGKTKPVILLIVEEALSAGVEEIGLIVQEGDKPLFENFFKRSAKAELLQKLSLESQEYEKYLQELGRKITLITQKTQEGYGHAVYCARDWVKDEPFLLLLGDHIYRSQTDRSCSRQLVEIYQRFSTSIIGLTIMSAEIIHKAGVVAGEWQEIDSLLKITQLSEKPSLDYARSHLQIQGMTEDNFLAVFGIYILEPKIFAYLEESIKNERRYKGEFQLTTCLDSLCQEKPTIGYIVDGRYFDTGMPEFYRQTILSY